MTEKIYFSKKWRIMGVVFGFLLLFITIFASGLHNGNSKAESFAGRLGICPYVEQFNGGLSDGGSSWRCDETPWCKIDYSTDKIDCKCNTLPNGKILCPPCAPPETLKSCVWTNPFSD